MVGSVSGDLQAQSSRQALDTDAVEIKGPAPEGKITDKVFSFENTDHTPSLGVPLRADGQHAGQQRVRRAGRQPHLAGRWPASSSWTFLHRLVLAQAAMESNDFEEDFKFEDDNTSQSSGDSIFIGVEDQTEFNDYTEKMKEIDVDMDLYSKLQGSRSADKKTDFA